MRDIDRINGIMQEFEKGWKLVPDWRLGQFILNFLDYVNKDIFYMEDDEFLEYLENYEEDILTE